MKRVLPPIISNEIIVNCKADMIRVVITLINERIKAGYDS